MSLESRNIFTSNISECNSNITSPIKVSLITVCFNLTSNIDLNKLKDVIKSTSSSCSTSFSNCLIINFYINDLGIKLDKDVLEDEYIKISAKLFSNGSVQLAGCKTIDIVHKIPKYIYNFLKKLDKKDNFICDCTKYKLADIRITMIKSDFSFNNKINQEKLKDLINNERIINSNWKIALWQPDKYPGVNIKYISNKSGKIITILVFKSGNAVITGSKNSEDTLDSFNAITNFILNNKDILK